MASEPSSAVDVGKRMSSVVNPVILMSSGIEPPMAPAIDGDRGDDDDPGHDLLHPVGKPHLGGAGADDGHIERPHQRPQNRPLPSREASSAADDGGDDVEREA